MFTLTALLLFLFWKTAKNTPFNASLRARSDEQFFLGKDQLSQKLCGKVFAFTNSKENC